MTTTADTPPKQPTSRRRLEKDDGYVIALTAILLIPLLVFVSLAVDLGSWYAKAAGMQRAADAAALAGVKYLPNTAKAESEARQVAARNGFAHDPGGTGITVAVTPAGGSKLKVTITDPSVEQYFSKVVTGNVSIARPATAEFVRSVPMGSPRNYLGTNDLNPGTANDEKFWLSVSGYCARHEHGDRITPRADNNGNGTSAGQSCVPAGTNPAGTLVQPNRDFRPDVGYFYGVDFNTNATQSWNLEVFDAAHCEGGGTGAGDSGTVGYTGPGNINGRSGERRYRFIVRSNDSLDPLTATILSDTTVSPTNCGGAGGYANQWRNFRTFPSGTTAGTYYLQVIPLVPTVQTGPGSQEGQNQFSIRMNPGGGTFPTGDLCSNDGTIVTTPDPACPNVFGLTHLGVYANLAVASASTQPSFYLASVDAQHNGREMEIELFDSAEGAQAIEILNPNGNPVNFTWEIACQDSTYRSENGGSCATSEQTAGPPGGWGPNTQNILNVSGTAPATNRPWRACTGTITTGCNTQDGRYSDRLVRLKVDLPADIAAAYSGRTWWRIRYTVPASGDLGDRTTWSITIKGDPLRLVPNE